MRAKHSFEKVKEKKVTLEKTSIAVLILNSCSLSFQGVPVAFSFFRGSHFRPSPLGGAGTAFSRFLETLVPHFSVERRKKEQSRIQTDTKAGVSKHVCRCQTGYILGQCGPLGLHHSAFVAR